MDLLLYIGPSSWVRLVCHFLPNALGLVFFLWSFWFVTGSLKQKTARVLPLSAGRMMLLLSPRGLVRGGRRGETVAGCSVPSASGQALSSGDERTFSV